MLISGAGCARNPSDDLSSLFATDAGSQPATATPQPDGGGAGATTGGAPDDDAGADGDTSGGANDAGSGSSGGNGGGSGSNTASGSGGSNGNSTGTSAGGSTGQPPDPPKPLPQGLILSELMPRPDGGSDNEWIELWNGTDEEIELDGCVISNGGSSSTSSFAIAGSVKVPTHSFALLTRENAEEQSGVVGDYIYDHFYMNTSETLTLTCAGELVDEVTFDDAPYQASLQLDERYVTAGLNDDESAWCASTSPMPLGDNLGTPGAPNLPCAGIPDP